MGRRKGEAHPPGVAGKDGSISKGVKRHYEKSPRTEEHNRAIGEGVSRARQAKKNGQ